MTVTNMPPSFLKTIFIIFNLKNIINFKIIFETLILPVHLTGLSAQRQPYLTHFLLLILINIHLFRHKLSKISLFFFFQEVYLNSKSAECLKSENIFLLIPAQMTSCFRYRILGFQPFAFQVRYSITFGFTCCREVCDQPAVYSL